jgi:hypothetical protein
MSPSVLARIRRILLGTTLFFGLVAYVFHTIALPVARDLAFLERLRVLGIITWLYALVQMLDMRFYHSRFARRRAAMGIPYSLHGWLFGQMLASFGIIHYGLTGDLRWYAAGVVILGLSFVAFPIVQRVTGEAFSGADPQSPGHN